MSDKDTPPKAERFVLIGSRISREKKNNPKKPQPNQPKQLLEGDIITRYYKE